MIGRDGLGGFYYDILYVFNCVNRIGFVLFFFTTMLVANELYTDCGTWTIHRLPTGNNLLLYALNFTTVQFTYSLFKYSLLNLRTVQFVPYRTDMIGWWWCVWKERDEREKERGDWDSIQFNSIQFNSMVDFFFFLKERESESKNTNGFLITRTTMHNLWWWCRKKVELVVNGSSLPLFWGCFTSSVFCLFLDIPSCCFWSHCRSTVDAFSFFPRDRIPFHMINNDTATYP